jgi:hypothetical protein
MPTPEESTASYCEGTPVTYPPESPVPVVHGAWTAVYFSTTTWMTVGYGDFVPATGQTQLIAMIEMIFGQIFNAILVGGTIILLIQRLA